MDNVFSRSLFWKLFLPVGALLLICGVAAAIVLPWMISNSAKEDAISAAEDTAAQFKSLRQYYTENVVAKVVGKGGVKASFDHRGDADTVPLPATMIHELSELFEKDGTSLKLYSPFPFPNRKDRAIDAFGRDAWEFLSASPDKTFSRTETVDGKTLVRVAVADRMSAPSCVACHNTLATSPKKDWKLGDVRGVLEIDSGRQMASGQQITARILAGLLITIGAIALFLRLVYSRSIARPMQQALATAEALAQGDLTVQVESRSKDELGRLMQALKGTVGQLASIVGRIKETSDTVGTASREIAQGNTDLSSRTEEQASALEETSASMQQMTATVGQNAQNAKKANDLAVQASAVAVKGGEVVREAVGTMNGITASSKKIADIIGVIDGIAFQTNILALNAAVEAARAGEQGRGFAVVASEVRSLAQRSAAAAKEIKDLITDSVSKVEAGSRQVNDAGRTMEEIVASVKSVTGLIAEITAASQEQASGIEQVSETMTQLEKVTQQNAAMVEEASAAAGSLEEQSRALASAVGAFRLEEQAPAVGLAAPASRPAQAKEPARTTKPLEAKKPPKANKLKAHDLPKKGNGHLEEGWQEF